MYHCIRFFNIDKKKKDSNLKNINKPISIKIQFQAPSSKLYNYSGSGVNLILVSNSLIT